ncbi:hypothetical protein L4C36_15320 [Photobacterium japonica]
MTTIGVRSKTDCRYNTRRAQYETATGPKESSYICQVKDGVGLVEIF